MKGKVYLVGAGPGDPDLLTVKATRVLQSADVVLHDSLVSPQVLALARQDAKVLNVGKRCGQKLLGQLDINSLLLHYAGLFRTVVRLKGGDPLIFGRAAEEIEALRLEGIDFEIVPGVTAGLAAAASAGISLTDRRSASRVLFTTWHRASESAQDWRSSAQGTTVVIYMPGSDYQSVSELLGAAGFSATTPCLLVCSTSLPEQQIRRTILRHLGAEPALPAPALLIVGDVAQSSFEATAGECLEYLHLTSP